MCCSIILSAGDTSIENPQLSEDYDTKKFTRIVFCSRPYMPLCEVLIDFVVLLIIIYHGDTLLCIYVEAIGFVPLQVMY